MTAIASGARRDTKGHGVALGPEILNIAVTATKVLKPGGLVCLVTAGTCEPGKTGTGLVALGVSDDVVDNSGSLSPAPVARIKTGRFSFGNSLSSDAITAAHVGHTVYMVDDATVALTDGGGTRSPAGTCCGLDDDGSQVIVAVSPLLPITQQGFSLQSRSLSIVGGATSGVKLGTAAGVGTGADTDNTNRVYPIGAAMPAGAIFVGLVIHLVTPFTNPLSSLALTVGGTDADGLVSAFDLVGNSAGYFDGTAGAQNIEAAKVAALTGQQITATLDPGSTDKVSESTVGEVKVTIFYLDATDA